jgi:hypothetical protein
MDFEWKEWANSGAIFPPELLFDRFSGGAVLNFRPIQNSDRFSEHLGWFKMGQNPWGKVLKCMEL